MGRYLKDPKMIWNVSVVANNHVGIVRPSPDGLITQDGTWPMTSEHNGRVITKKPKNPRNPQYQGQYIVRGIKGVIVVKNSQ